MRPLSGIAGSHCRMVIAGLLGLSSRKARDNALILPTLIGYEESICPIDHRDVPGRDYRQRFCRLR